MCVKTVSSKLNMQRHQTMSGLQRHEGKLWQNCHSWVRYLNEKYNKWLVEVLLILLKEIPFWVSFVEQVRVAIWKLSLVIGMRPAWWKDFPVCLSFSSTSAYEPGRVKYVLASSVFFTSTCRNRRGTWSGTACLKQKGHMTWNRYCRYKGKFRKVWRDPKVA